MHEIYVSTSENVNFILPFIKPFLTYVGEGFYVLE